MQSSQEDRPCTRHYALDVLLPGVVLATLVGDKRGELSRRGDCICKGCDMRRVELGCGNQRKKIVGNKYEDEHDPNHPGPCKPL